MVFAHRLLEQLLSGRPIQQGKNLRKKNGKYAHKFILVYYFNKLMVNHGGWNIIAIASLKNHGLFLEKQIEAMC